MFLMVADTQVSVEPECDLLLPPVTDENVCLPLSINVVARYWNVDLPLSEAIEIAKAYPGVDGSILIEGIEMAERHGLSAVILHYTIGELKNAMDGGIPPIVILPGVQRTLQHASVISGYNSSEETIFHYIPHAAGDGEFQVGVIPEKKFDETWEEDGRIAILISPREALSGISLPAEKILRSARLCFESEKQNLLKRPDLAVKSLQEAISLDGSNQSAYCLLAGILNEQNSAECTAYYDKCLKINGRSYLACRGLGNYYLKNKQYSKADEYYTRAISINPSRYGPIYKNRGIARLEQKDNAAAKEDLEEYLKQTPGASDASSIRAALREL